jgi:hypothetical protein
VEVVDGKVATMANGDVENSSTVHRGLARCAVTWSSSKKKKKGVSGSLERRIDGNGVGGAVHGKMGES